MCYNLGMKVLELNNVSFSYKINLEDEKTEYVEAVKNVSFSIEEGEFVCLIGHNGSGKSTLAKLFNGLNFPQAGVVKVLGETVANNKKLFDIRKNIGLVFQNPDNQMVATIVEDDIAFGPENIGVPSLEIRERVDFALKSVDMQAHRDTDASRLSGGQKQRIAIAGVLALQPKILVLDESTAMLDPMGRAEVLSTVRHLNKTQNITVILITHFMEEAILADRIFIMDNGELKKTGTPKEIFCDYKFLQKCGLELPSAAKVRHFLNELEIGIDKTIICNEELIEQVVSYRK
ncbi:MAG: energy-coupling factor transporter ATPase [Firmicutes bacterium]|nr:energy-coupling factor transporter ATPase [Bacillota bacterium]